MMRSALAFLCMIGAVLPAYAEHFGTEEELVRTHTHTTVSSSVGESCAEDSSCSSTSYAAIQGDALLQKGKCDWACGDNCERSDNGKCFKCCVCRKGRDQCIQAEKEAEMSDDDDNDEAKEEAEMSDDDDNEDTEAQEEAIAANARAEARAERRANRAENGGQRSGRGSDLLQEGEDLLALDQFLAVDECDAGKSKCPRLHVCVPCAQSDKECRNRECQKARQAASPGTSIAASSGTHGGKGCKKGKKCGKKGGKKGGKKDKTGKTGK